MHTIYLYLENIYFYPDYRFGTSKYISFLIGEPHPRKSSNNTPYN